MGEPDKVGSDCPGPRPTPRSPGEDGKDREAIISELDAFLNAEGNITQTAPKL